MERDSQGIRKESDTTGEVALPAWAYWGAQTQRAVENFGVSDKRIPPLMIQALGLIKQTAAEVNAELETVPADLAEAIAKAAEEVREGRWNEHFPIDVFQTGSGTSWNMNANEVIANRAFKEKKTVRQLLGESDLLSPEEVDKALDPKSMIGEQG